MRLSILSLFLLAICLLQTGCAMCCATYDYAYAGHGGKWQRGDLFHGRVASPFSDPHYAQGGRVDGELLDAELIDGTQMDDSHLELIN